eukprot:c15502_g1_i1.p1 GENE.c15502_g1_i1~~c15502_g1_i1.p1  ORF type:complete len:281 (+),score=96.69 c15502_g1_i1:16-858(+)
MKIRANEIVFLVLVISFISLNNSLTIQRHNNDEYFLNELSYELQSIEGDIIRFKYPELYKQMKSEIQIKKYSTEMDLETLTNLDAITEKIKTLNSFCERVNRLSCKPLKGSNNRFNSSTNFDEGKKLLIEIGIGVKDIFETCFSSFDAISVEAKKTIAEMWAIQKFKDSITPPKNSSTITTTIVNTEISDEPFKCTCDGTQTKKLAEKLKAKISPKLEYFFECCVTPSELYLMALQLTKNGGEHAICTCPATVLEQEDLSEKNNVSKNQTLPSDELFPTN